MDKQPRIYMLHRVLKNYDEKNYYYQRQTGISWKKFIELLDTIEKKGWKTKPISALAKGYTHNDVFITFDDGYRDNIGAFDELINRGMIATVYPVKDFVLDGFSPIDDMALHLMSTPNVPKDLSLSLLGGRLKRILRGITASRYRYLRQRLFGIDVDADSTHLFMQEHHLKLYNSQGIELGIHGCSHRAFTQLSPSELNKELTENYNWIRGLGCRESMSICFPHGKHNKKVIEQSQLFGLIHLGVDCETFYPSVLRRIHITEDYCG
jgi:peptidoglycan/xylan/chitin deacetylase (PgdA/CDA1 family)|tara:strand:+ start:4310 stop:5107 length:798 start_codon:yes stop_codon:yes gene_type:complete